MLEEISNFLQKPNIYTPSKTIFWKDEYISKQLLKSHLSLSSDQASRKINFIEKSVKWIADIIPPSKYSNLIDLGCGPGLYAERFSMLGFKVTGIDFSKRSIEYAKKSALNKSLKINYLNKSYLELDLNEIFDLATLIYCDYGALSTPNQKKLLKKIYNALKPNGRLLLDVFSMEKYKNFCEMRSWNVFENGGFWSKNKYLELKHNCKYPNNITLDQYTIISTKSIKNYYIWNTYFSKKSFTIKAYEVGFKVIEIFGDIAGKQYADDSETIAILLEK